MPTSRRGFFRLTASVGGSAALLSACGRDEGAAETGTAPVTVEDDVQRLNVSLDLEHTAVAAYTVGTTVLEAPVLEMAQAFLRHEQAHAAELSRLVRQLGGTPHQPKSAEEYAESFPALEDRDEVLRFAVELEQDALRAYLNSGPRMADPCMRQTASAIATVQAEHLSVLLGALGEPPAPDAFVIGA